MKRYLISMVSIVALVLALALPVSVPAAIPAPRPQSTTSASAERPHKEIRDAISSLHAARNYLQSATQDFGGHRAVALRAIDESLHQLQLCQSYDQ